MVAHSSRPLPLGAGRCLSRLYLAVARASPPCRGRVPLGQGRASRCLTGPTEGPCGRSHASGVVWPSAYHPGPLGLRVACPALPLWPWRGVALCSLPALGCPRPAGRSPPARVAAAGPRVWARWVSPRPHRLWEHSCGVAAPGAGGSDVGGWRPQEAGGSRCPVSRALAVSHCGPRWGASGARRGTRGVAGGGLPASQACHGTARACGGGIPCPFSGRTRLLLARGVPRGSPSRLWRLSPRGLMPCPRRWPPRGPLRPRVACVRRRALFGVGGQMAATVWPVVLRGLAFTPIVGGGVCV